MSRSILLFICVGLLFLGCSQRVIDPVEESVLSFKIVDCDEAEEFFQGEEASFAKPFGYYACACPNKSLPLTEITFTLPEATHVRLTIRGATGYKIKTLIDETVAAGHHTVNWDNKNDKGETVKPGIYIYALRTGTGHKADSFMILKD